MSNITTTKKCSKCGETKDVGLFSKKKDGKDGLNSRCKACDKAHREANKEKIAAKKKAYRDANKEKIAAYNEANKEKTVAYQKAYREANKEELSAKDKAYREANKEKIAAQKKAYCEANKEGVAARDKAWREANPELVEVRNVIRRAERGRKTALEIYGLPDKETVRQLREAKLAIYRKYYDDEPNLDHMHPLAEAKGDIDELHRRSHFTNLVYIPAKANLAKSAKPFWDWLAELNDEKLFDCIAEQDDCNRNINQKITKDS